MLTEHTLYVPLTLQREVMLMIAVNCYASPHALQTAAQYALWVRAIKTNHTD